MQAQARWKSRDLLYRRNAYGYLVHEGPPEKQRFVIGDLVYYQGFDIFERHPAKRHMGIVIAGPGAVGAVHAPHSYYVFWFESSLTTRMHRDNMKLVYETKAISIERLS